MARYSSNFGNKLQMMAKISTEYGFTSNTAVFPTQNGVTAQNGEQQIRLQKGLLYPRVEVEQRTHSGDEIVSTQTATLIVRLHNLEIFKRGFSFYDDISRDS